MESSSERGQSDADSDEQHEAAATGRQGKKRLTAGRILTRLARDSLDDIYFRRSPASSSSPSTRSTSTADIPAAERASTATPALTLRGGADIAITAECADDDGLTSSVDNTAASSSSLDDASASSSKSSSASSLPRKLKAVDIRKQLLALGDVADSAAWAGGGLHKPAAHANASSDRSLQELKQEFLNGPAVLSARNKDALTADRESSFDGCALEVNASDELRPFSAADDGNSESLAGSRRCSLTYAQRPSHLPNLSPRPSSSRAVEGKENFNLPRLIGCIKGATIDKLVSTSSSTASSTLSLEATTTASPRPSGSISAGSGHRIGSKLRAAEILRSGRSGPRDSLDFLAGDRADASAEGSADRIALHDATGDGAGAPKGRRMSSPTLPVAASFDGSSSSSFDEAGALAPAAAAAPGGGRSSVRLTASEIVRKFAKDSLENLAAVGRIAARKDSDSAGWTSSEGEESDDTGASSDDRASSSGSMPCSPQTTRLAAAGFDGHDLRRVTSLRERERPGGMQESPSAPAQAQTPRERAEPCAASEAAAAGTQQRKKSLADLKKEFLEGPPPSPPAAASAGVGNARAAAAATATAKYRTHSKLAKPLKSILKPERPPSNFDPVTLAVTPSDGSLSQVCSRISKASVGSSLNGSRVLFGSDDDFGAVPRQSKVKWIKYFISDVKTFRKDVAV
ncbi:hypothetical protein HDU83_000770 [Entophlyctis luteolus]|nr:hypothetical protein HDU83_000770 [Entophlyctis luteolus]